MIPETEDSNTDRWTHSSMLPGKWYLLANLNSPVPRVHYSDGEAGKRNINHEAISATFGLIHTGTSPWDWSSQRLGNIVM